MVRGEIPRRAGSHLKQTQVSLIENSMEKYATKPKTDGRVKRYCALMIPEALHRRLKTRARDKRLRLNQYIPRLLAKALRHEK